jgi:hypothetical protein
LIIGVIFLLLSIAVGTAAWWYVRVLDARMAAGKSGRKKSSLKGARDESYALPCKSKKKDLSVQELWGVESIQSGVIVFSDGWYRTLLKIGPIDYHLMNENEQYSIESVLMSCAMALGFRIQLFSTAELVDTKSSASAIRSFMESQQNPSEAMLEYGLNMYSYLSSMMQNRNVHNRPRYIAVSYYTPDGFDKARNELRRRAQVLVDNLRRAKITADMLSSEQVLDVLYRFNNRGRVMKPSDAVVEGTRDLYATGRRGVQTNVLPDEKTEHQTA